VSPAFVALLTGVLVAAIGIALLLRILNALSRMRITDPQVGLLVAQQMDALREQLRISLEGSRAELDRRLEETNRIVGDVRRGLGAVDEQVRSVSDMTRDLRSLQELLRSPKLRGGLGETLLGDLLAQVLPREHFTLQHAFDGGERVDACLRIGGYLVSVDAKFPMENFLRLRTAQNLQDDRASLEARRGFRTDVRRHVDAIGRRYIRPGEGTFDFALMYIPAEAVYQEILTQSDEGGSDLLDYALQHRVVPVSPQSFYAYLQVIVLGLRGLSIEAHAREVVERVGGVRSRLERLAEVHDLAQRHLANAQRQFDEAGRRLDRLRSAVDHLAGSTLGDEPAPQSDSVDRTPP
jgi:DNA recombination protein RmuC